MNKGRKKGSRRTEVERNFGLEEPMYLLNKKNKFKGIQVGRVGSVSQSDGRGNRNNSHTHTN
jgi:hypothetical protein